MEVAKLAKKFTCSICNYKCSKKSDMNKHQLTGKHLHGLNGSIRKSPNSPNGFTCNICNKIYKTHSGLWKHKQICNDASNNTTSEINNTIVDSHNENKIVSMLMQQNQEFKDLLVNQNKTIIELSKNNHSTINNSGHMNSHNKTFNLQFFLNETCKDAMNLSDFVKSLQLNFAELEKMGEVGFAEGLSRMFVRGLNELDVTKRPIHCTDVKRDIMHIKNEGKWERESADQKQIKKAIKQIENRNVMHLYDWKDAHPGCGDWDSKLNTKFLKMQYEAMGSGGEEQELKDYKKIIHKVSENTIIDKEKYKNL